MSTSGASRTLQGTPRNPVRDRHVQLHGCAAHGLGCARDRARRRGIMATSTGSPRRPIRTWEQAGLRRRPARRWCLDPEKVEAAITPRPKRSGGASVRQPLRDGRALRNRPKPRLPVIEDAAEAMGSRWTRSSAPGPMGLLRHVFVSRHQDDDHRRGRDVRHQRRRPVRTRVTLKQPRPRSQARPSSSGRTCWASNTRCRTSRPHRLRAQLSRMEEADRPASERYSVLRVASVGDLPLALNPSRRTRETVTGCRPSWSTDSFASIATRCSTAFAGDSIDARVFFAPLSHVADV